MTYCKTHSKMLLKDVSEIHVNCSKTSQMNKCTPIREWEQSLRYFYKLKYFIVMKVHNINTASIKNYWLYKAGTMTQTYNLRHLGEWGRNVIPGQPGQKVQGIPQEIPLQPTKPRYDDTVLLSRLFGVVNRKTLLQVSLIIEVRCNSQTAKASAGHASTEPRVQTPVSPVLHKEL
jgi:hypothetical protein